MTDYPMLDDKLATLRNAIEGGVEADSLQALKLMELVDAIGEQFKLELDDVAPLADAAAIAEREAHLYEDDPERQWVEFWAPICAPNGSLDLEQVKRELSDYSMLLSYVPRVYDHATGGAVSKPNTTPAAVCSVIDDHIQDLVEDAIRDDRLSLANPSDKARTKMVADMEAEQTYIASCRETCSDHDLLRWDRIQAVIDHLKAVDDARATLATTEATDAIAPTDARAAEKGWRVGEFRSSSNPRKTVLMLAVGSDIEAHQKHHSFIRWVDAAPSPEAPAVDAPMTEAVRFFWQQHTLSDTSAMSMAELHNVAECVIRGRRAAPMTGAIAPTEGAVAWPVPLSIETNYEVGQTVELIFESDEDAETFSRLYSEHMGDAAPSPEAPAVDALTTGALEDDMVEYLYDLARGYTREKFAFHLQSLFNGRAHPASEPKALTRNKLHTLLIRHAVSFAEWDDGSLEYVNFGQYGFEAFFSELLRATDRANAPSSEEES